MRDLLSKLQRHVAGAFAENVREAANVGVSNAVADLLNLEIALAKKPRCFVHTLAGDIIAVALTVFITKMNFSVPYCSG